MINILKQIIAQQSKEADQNIEDYFNQNIEIELKYCVFKPRSNQEYMNYNIAKNLSNKSGIHYYKENSCFTAGY